MFINKLIVIQNLLIKIISSLKLVFYLFLESEKRKKRRINYIYNRKKIKNL